MAATEGFDYTKFNLVIDHRNGNRSDNRFINFALVPQSKNLEGRILSIPKRFTENELMDLKDDFKQLELKHGKVMDTYQELADKYKCSPHTVQVKYLEWKRVN